MHYTRGVLPPPLWSSPSFFPPLLPSLAKPILFPLFLFVALCVHVPCVLSLNAYNSAMLHYLSATLALLCRSALVLL
jgi:hypothetical protein